MNRTNTYVVVATLVAMLMLLVYFVIDVRVQTAALTDRIDEIKAHTLSYSTSRPSSSANTEAHLYANLVKRIDKHSNQILALKQKMDDLAARLGQLHSETLLPTPSRDTRTRESISVMKERQQDDRDRQSRLSADRRHQELDQFYSEPIDEIWSRTTEVSLEKSFTAPTLDGAELTYSECRNARCEVRWRIDQGLNDLERFEMDNKVLIEMAKLGMGSAVFMEALESGEFRAIVKRRDTTG